MDFPADLGLHSFLEREASVLREAREARDAAFTQPPRWLRRNAPSPWALRDGAAYLVLCALDPKTAVLPRDAVLTCVKRLYEKLHLRGPLLGDVFDDAHPTGMSEVAWRCIAAKLQRTVLLCDPASPPFLVAYEAPEAEACLLLLREAEGYVMANDIGTLTDGIARAKGVLQASASAQALHAAIEGMLRRDMEVLRRALGLPERAGERKPELAKRLKEQVAPQA
jgi:hypothetical protein